MYVLSRAPTPTRSGFGACSDPWQYIMSMLSRAEVDYAVSLLQTAHMKAMKARPKSAKMKG
jgi:hypothetical protein